MMLVTAALGAAVVYQLGTQPEPISWQAKYMPDYSAPGAIETPDRYPKQLYVEHRERASNLSTMEVSFVHDDAGSRAYLGIPKEHWIIQSGNKIKVYGNHGKRLGRIPYGKKLGGQSPGAHYIPKWPPQSSSSKESVNGKTL